MSLADRISGDIEKARECFPNVSDFKHDGEVLTFQVDEQEFCVVLPEVYGCSCEIYGPDDTEIAGRGSIVDIVTTVLTHLGCMTDVSTELPVPSLLRSVSDEPVTMTSGEDFMEEVLESSGKSIVEKVQAEICELESLGVSGKIDADSHQSAFVTMSFPLFKVISKPTAEAWGFAYDKPLNISFSVNDAHYARSASTASSRLEARAWQEQTIDGYAPLDAAVQLVNLIRSFWSLICGVRVEGSSCDAHAPVSDTLLAKKSSVFDAAQSLDGVLLPVASYLTKRLPCLHEFCVICDEPLIFPPLLRPTICTRALCSYSARAFGTAVTGEFSGQNASLEIWDLLVAMAICASQMNEDRMQILFADENFPTLFLPGNPAPAFAADKDGFRRLRSLLTELRNYRTREVGSHGIFWLNRVFKDEKISDPLLGPLLGWIWDSNRSYIVALHTEERIQELRTPYQYLLLSAPPEMEAAFQEHKAKHGSEFCFHGSQTANWHCILRQGLKNASGTKLMTAGQAHGPGIYLARDAATSASYSGMFGHSGRPAPSAPALARETTGQRVHDPDSLVMLAICEVALVPKLKKAGNIWVCPEEAAVVTRFFLVFHLRDMPNVQLSDSTLVEKIRALMGKWSLS